MTTFKPSDTSPGPAAYENGSIWWKGSSDGWLWLHREQAENLMFDFANQPEPQMQAYAKALARVIRLHDQHNREEAA